MGTDIHLWVERRTPTGWRRVMPTEIGYREYPDWVDDGGTDWFTDWRRKKQLVAWYRGRNYALFGMLANVRNGRGFAGIQINSGTEVLAMPRGWPEDLSPELKAWFAYHEQEDEDFARNVSFPPGDVRPGYHDESWLLLSELQNPAFWANHLYAYGIVEAEVLAGMASVHAEPQVNGFPIPRRGDTVIEQPHLVKEAWLRLRKDPTVAAEYKDTYFSIRWSAGTYAECAGDFYERLLPALATLGSPQEVRIVFNFDS